MPRAAPGSAARLPKMSKTRANATSAAPAAGAMAYWPAPSSSSVGGVWRRTAARHSDHMGRPLTEVLDARYLASTATWMATLSSIFPPPYVMPKSRLSMVNALVIFTVPPSVVTVAGNEMLFVLPLSVRSPVIVVPASVFSILVLVNVDFGLVLQEKKSGDFRWAVSFSLSDQ